MLKIGRKLFSASYVSQKFFENPIGIPERQELFAGLQHRLASSGENWNTVIPSVNTGF